jgi:hypothetical protein
VLPHELLRKMVRRLRKSVIWTDIPVRPESIALRIMKGLARRIEWLLPRVNPLLSVNARALFIADYIRRLTPRTKSTARPLMKRISTRMRSLNAMEHRWGERTGVERPVTVSAGQERAIRSCMRNLSVSGALVRIGAGLHLHALTEVCVYMLTPREHHPRLLAHVSRKSKLDVGIE